MSRHADDYWPLSKTTDNAALPPVRVQADVRCGNCRWWDTSDEQKVQIEIDGIPSKARTPRGLLRMIARRIWKRGKA